MAFLDGKIGFLDIERTVFDVCDGFAAYSGRQADIGSVKEADREARMKALEVLKKNYL